MVAAVGVSRCQATVLAGHTVAVTHVSPRLLHCAPRPVTTSLLQHILSQVPQTYQRVLTNTPEPATTNQKSVLDNDDQSEISIR